MRITILFFILFSSFYSNGQELSLVDYKFQINEDVVFVENPSTASETMSRFNNWKNKIDTIIPLIETSNSFDGTRLITIENNNLKYDLKFKITNTGFIYTYTNIKYIVNNIETNIEDLSDLQLKSQLVSKLNEHFLDLSKSLKLELQDF